MQPATASPAVMIGYEILVPADMLAQDEDVRSAYSDHSRPRLCTGKLEPVTGEPEIADGLTEDLDGGPASAECSTRATYRMGKILRLVSRARTSAAMNMTGHGLALNSMKLYLKDRLIVMEYFLSVGRYRQANECRCRKGFEHESSMCYC